MKLFHISDVLSVTTGLLVSNRHMAALYEIYNFLTGDELFTHQLPRVAGECDPWLASQYPQLMKDAPEMQNHIAKLSKMLKSVAEDDRSTRWTLIRDWVESVRLAFGLPEELPLYELGASMTGRIDIILPAGEHFPSGMPWPVAVDNLRRYPPCAVVTERRACSDGSEVEHIEAATVPVVFPHLSPEPHGEGGRWLLARVPQALVARVTPDEGKPKRSRPTEVES